MHKLLFIINPAAGSKKRFLNKEIIAKHLDLSKFEFEVVFTESQKRANTITAASKDTFDGFVAVGGDGTINEIGREVVGTDKILAIIPAGSGNGLARSLGIPLKAADAIRVINNFQVKSIDAVTVNGEYFFNVAGVGFDAYVAKMFDGKEKRGLNGYVKVIAQKFFRYEGKEFRWRVNGHEESEKAFLMSFANTTQFGNNAHIAPHAKFDDGKFEFCVLKDFPRWKTPGLAVKLFNKTLDQSPYYQSKSLEKLELKCEGKVWAHLDGEPRTFHDQLHIVTRPGSIRVIANMPC